MVWKNLLIYLGFSISRRKHSCKVANSIGRDFVQILLGEVFILALKLFFSLRLLSLEELLNKRLVTVLSWRFLLTNAALWSPNAQRSPLVAKFAKRAPESTQRCSHIGRADMAAGTPIQAYVIRGLLLNNLPDLGHLLASWNAPCGLWRRLFRSELIYDGMLRHKLNPSLADKHELAWIKLEIQGHFATKLNVLTL